jgi:hypothetical protein
LEKEIDKMNWDEYKKKLTLGEKIDIELLKGVNPKFVKSEGEYCPKCETELEHFTIGREDVFGCPKCKKEIPRKNSIKKYHMEMRW